MDTGLSFGVMHSEWKHCHAPESPISARPKSFVVGSAGLSAKGQSRHSDCWSITSGLPRTSDISGPGRHFAVGPEAVFIRLKGCRHVDGDWQHPYLAPRQSKC